MPLGDINKRMYIERAIHDCDALGRERFLRQYHYGRSRDISLIYEGRQYDAKAIVGVAHQYVPNSLGPLSNRDFNSRHDAEPLLWQLGFDTVDNTRHPDFRHSIGELETEYQRQVWLRRNQAIFSGPVKSYWRNRCAVTGIKDPSLLKVCLRVGQTVSIRPDENTSQ